MAVSVSEGRRRSTGVYSRLAPGWLGDRLGLIIVAVGLLVIGLGWNGMAGAGGEVNHVPVLQAQLPWLLSGGFLGLGIVGLGVGVLISHGYRQDVARLDSRLVALLEAVERLDGIASAPVATATTPIGAGADLVLAGADSYHLPTCRLVAHRSEARLLTPDQAAAEGMTPCRICRPPVGSAQSPGLGAQVGAA